MPVARKRRQTRNQICSGGSETLKARGFGFGGNKYFSALENVHKTWMQQTLQ